MRTEITTTGAGKWLAVSEPENEELVGAIRELGLVREDVEFLLNNHHRPEVTVRDNYILILVEIPAFDRKTRVTTGVPVYVVMTEEIVLTVNFERLPALEKLREMAGSKLTDARTPADLGLEIIDKLLESAAHKLEKLDKHVSIAEEAVFAGNEAAMVMEVATLQRDAMDFRKVLRSQLHLFTAVPDNNLLDDETKTKWKRLHRRVGKLWDLLEGIFESTRDLRETNVGLLQHKENEILRMLTYYSIISIPVVILITPINPFHPETSAWQAGIFWGVLISLFSLLFILFYRFRRRGVL